MLPIRVKFGWLIWMTSHWDSSGSHSVQHFIGNLDDWSLLPDLVSPVNLQRTHFVLLSRLLTKTLISIGTSTDPLGTSLVTSCQLDFVPLITILWAQQPGQVSTHYILYLTKTQNVSSVQFGSKNTTGDHIKNLPKSKASNTQCSSKSHKASQLITKKQSGWLGRVWTSKSMLTVPKHLGLHVPGHSFQEYFLHRLPRNWG